MSNEQETMKLAIIAHCFLLIDFLSRAPIILRIFVAILPVTSRGIREALIAFLGFLRRRWRIFCDRRNTLPVLVTLNLIFRTDGTLCFGISVFLPGFHRHL